MTAESLDVGAARPLPLDELDFRFSRSGGPGGQHVNTSSTRVEVIWDVAASPSLNERERRRLVERLGGRLDSAGRLRVVAQDERSQRRNRGLALDRLADLVREALAPPPPPRRATRPTATARRERVDQKRRAGETKRLRQPPGGDE
jgi:ribosome-associated protein